MRQITYRDMALSRPLFRPHRAEGFDGATVRDDADQDQPRGDGALPGDHWLAPRLATLSGLTAGWATTKLLAALQPSRRGEPALTWIDEADQNRMLFCRVIDLQLDRRPNSGGWHDTTVVFKASDPRIYGGRHVIPIVPYQVLGGGLDYPVNYPKQYGPNAAIEQIASNGGDSDAHPTIRIHGPQVGTLTSWRLTNVTNGSAVQVDTPIGPGQLLTVRLREWVVADPAAMIVELDGQSRYGGWVTRPETLWLSPGSNVLRLTVLSGDDPASAEIVYRDTWGGIRQGVNGG